MVQTLPSPMAFLSSRGVIRIKPHANAAAAMPSTASGAPTYRLTGRKMRINASPTMHPTSMLSGERNLDSSGGVSGGGGLVGGSSDMVWVGQTVTDDPAVEQREI